VSNAAESLTSFLTQPDYRGKSPLVQRVEAGISALANTIADEVIGENPDLVDVLRSKARDAVRAVLKTDPLLDQIVTAAVAQALVKHALDQDDND
jgi:hypothetical protein